MSESGEVPLFVNSNLALKLTGLNRWTVERAALRGRVHFRNVLGRTEFSLADLQRLAAERQATAGPIVSDDAGSSEVTFTAMESIE